VVEPSDVRVGREPTTAFPTVRHDEPDVPLFLPGQMRYVYRGAVPGVMSGLPQPQPYC
jgi:hypothetical protein